MRDMGTKFWSFIYVVTWVGVLALYDKATAELLGFLGTIFGVLVGIQFARRKLNGASNGSSPPAN